MSTPLPEEPLDEILKGIDLDYVPPEFVAGACVFDLKDAVRMVSSAELEEIMENELSLEEQGISDIGLILNYEEIKLAAINLSEIILKDLAY